MEKFFKNANERTLISRDKNLPGCYPINSGNKRDRILILALTGRVKLSYQKYYKLDLDGSQWQITNC